MLFLLGLYEHFISHFFLRSIISTKKLSAEGKLWHKDALSSLRQFLANESPLKLMKNAFHLTLKALLVLKIFKFLS